MSARVAVSLAVSLGVLAPSVARAADKPDAGAAVKTSTVATSLSGLSAKDLELARWLDLLGDFEVLEDLECLELMPILEDDHEP